VCIFRKHYPRAERAFMKKCLSPDVGDSLRKVPDDKRHRRMSAAVAAAKAKDPMVWCRLCEVKWHKNATPKVNPPPAKEKDAGCSGTDAQWGVRGPPGPAPPDDAARSPPSPPPCAGGLRPRVVSTPAATPTVENKYGGAPAPVYVLCGEPQGADAKWRMAVGPSAPVSMDSPGRYLTADYDFLVRVLARVGCNSPACSPAHRLEPLTEQEVSGGSLVVECRCPACGVREQFNLAGRIRKARAHEAAPHRTDLEASEMAAQQLSGGLFKHMAARARLQGRSKAVGPNKRLWLATEETLSGPTKRLKGEYAATSRRLIKELGDNNTAIGFDAGHNHPRNATAAAGAFVVIAPASYGGLILESEMISKKVTRYSSHSSGYMFNYTSEQE